MTLHRYRNGKKEPLSREEEMAVRAEWRANDARQAVERKRFVFHGEAIRRSGLSVRSWDEMRSMVVIARELGLTAPARMDLSKRIYDWVETTAFPKMAALPLGEAATIDPKLDDPFGDGTAWPT